VFVTIPAVAYLLLVRRMVPLPRRLIKCETVNPKRIVNRIPSYQPRGAT